MCIFGEIDDDEMRLSQAGTIAEQCWEEIPKHFSNVELDEFVVMPNHIHGIIIINETDDIKINYSRDVQLNVPTRLSPKRGSLSVIIRTCKAAVTTECRRNGHNEFRWQSRFYEHIIRDEKELHKIRDYIANNILKWAFDSSHEMPDNLCM